MPTSSLHSLACLTYPQAVAKGSSKVEVQVNVPKMFVVNMLINITVLFRPSVQSHVTSAYELNTFDLCHAFQGVLNTVTFYTKKGKLHKNFSKHSSTYRSTLIPHQSCQHCCQASHHDCNENYVDEAYVHVLGVESQG